MRSRPTIIQPPTRSAARPMTKCPIDTSLCYPASIDLIYAQEVEPQVLSRTGGRPETIELPRTEHSAGSCFRHG
jgi:hypothetical protein